MVRPDTGEVVEEHEYEKVPRDVVARLGGIALREKWGRDHFKRIGKIGYAVTVNKIQDMIANPDKYEVDADDIRGYVDFLRHRLQATTDTYRNQFARAWRAGYKELQAERPVVYDDPRKREFFSSVNEKLFGARAAAEAST